VIKLHAALMSQDYAATDGQKIALASQYDVAFACQLAQ
jgi:hypothetical protein